MAEIAPIGETAFETEVVAIVLEMMRNGEIEEIFRAKIKKGFEDAITSSFTWGGEMRKAIDKKIKESLVPMIQNLDMESYIPKLDALLSQIVKETDLSENARIIETFGVLMNTDKRQTITLEELFEKYGSYVADECDTSDLEVNLDDEPSYEYVTTHALVERSDRHGFSSCFEHAVLSFYADDQEDLLIQVPISRYDRDDYWELAPTCNRRLSDLARSNVFEVLIAALSHQNAHLLIGSDELEDEVEPNATPEPSWG